MSSAMSFPVMLADVPANSSDVSPKLEASTEWMSVTSPPANGSNLANVAG